MRISRPFRVSLLLLGTVLSAPAEVLEAFGLHWDVPAASDWRFQNNVLHLLVPRPSTHPRRPSQFALAQTPSYTKVTFEAEMQPEPKAIRNRRNSLILVYAWRDQDHFNYAHLSVDSAREAAVHNGIFHVYGGDRVRISSQDGPGTLTDGRWHQVKLVYDGSTGRVDVWVNGQTSPSLRAVDMSLGAGKIGIGSFFDTGTFRNVRISGKD
ncbi:MAG TPA: family 16 glycoside hydrolase [Bryobacteraceae bacterium]|nr:family 16 glycoside hydrolase [Bryobacteraceae bacterium]